MRYIQRIVAVAAGCLVPAISFADFDMVQGNDTAIIVPVCLYSATDGVTRITNITSEDPGLKITLAYENSDTPLVYDATGEIEPITTARTWAAPSASNVRFEVGTDGCYELQFAANSFESGNGALLTIEDTSSPTFAAREVRIHFRATGTDIQSYVHAALVALGLDHLIVAASDGTEPVNNSLIARIVSKAATASFASYNNTSDSLEAQADVAASALATTEALADYIASSTVSGAVASATTTTITAAALVASNARAYVGMTFYWPIGGQSARVTAFNPATDTITLDYALSSAPSASDPFVLLAGPTSVASIISGGSPATATGDAFSRLGAPTGASIAADLFDLRADIPPSLIGGRMDVSVGAMQDGVVTAAAVATDAIDADALSAGATTEIANALLAAGVGPRTLACVLKALEAVSYGRYARTGNDSTFRSPENDGVEVNGTAPSAGTSRTNTEVTCP